ncbi:MAG: PmoA family protein [Planctomycetaceae bacterium]|nr:PmoA family protein [Planctomycetaceae bacterium]
MSLVIRFSVLIAGLFLPVCFAEESVELTSTPTESGFAVQVNGRPFAEYRYVGEFTPDIWPLYSPTGKLATRAFPMAEKEKNEDILQSVRKVAPFESRDHGHHRSVWFHFGDVNGVDFWNIGPNRPHIRCQDAQILESSRNQIVLKSQNDWVAPATQDKPENVVCQDVRTITFGVISDKIWFIDYDVRILAVDHDVQFGDTKEGLFAIRVPGTVEVDSKARNPNWGGLLVNAEGLKNVDSWGKRSRWVDYTGPVYEQDPSRNEPDRDAPMSLFGITVMNHPDSFRYPTWWHVRTYGLLDANPFALTEFQAGEDGRETVKKGESLLFCYRVLLHDSVITPEQIEQLFDEYAKTSKR